MDIGQAVKEMRKTKNVKQYVLAFDAGISQNYLSQIERGKRKPSMFTLESIVKALEVPLPFLFWKAISPEDVQENKREFFKTIKPSVDELLKELI